MQVLDHVKGWLARRLTGLPAAWQRRLSGGAAITRDGLTLDPQMQLLLRFRARLDTPALASLTPVEARALARRESAATAGRAVRVGAVRDLTVDGAAHPLRARHYAPTPDGTRRPLLVFLHGGGFVIGDLDTHDRGCRLLCRYANVHVLAVEYRLAPEHPFPAPVFDARAALGWAIDHAAALGADPDMIAVGGDSAGGNLATVICRLALADGGTVPVAQLLIYPAVDSLGTYPSKDLFAEGFFLTREDMDWFELNYGGDPADPRRSPIYADPTGQPPALIVTAGFDPLRDQGEAYARMLAAAGIRAELHREAGLVHGFMNMSGVSSAARGAVIRLAERFGALLSQLAERRPSASSTR